MSKPIIKPVALAVCTAVGGLSLSASAFAMHELPAGYMLGATAAMGHDGKDHDGKGHEGKCGIEKVDTDRDGRISRSEFDAAHRDGDERFADIDGNGDGFIDSAEHDAHHGAARAETGMKAGEGKCGEGKCGGSA